MAQAGNSLELRLHLRQRGRIDTVAFELLDLPDLVALRIRRVLERNALAHPAVPFVAFFLASLVPTAIAQRLAATICNEARSARWSRASCASR